MKWIYAWMRELRAGSRGEVMQETPSVDLRADDAEDAVAARLLRQLPPIPSGAEARVRRALAASRARDAGIVAEARRKAPFVLALAAAVALAVVSQVPEEAVPLAAPLASADRFASFSPREGVTLSFNGSGTVGGTSVAPVVDWQLGTLHVEVTPDQGIALAVTTEEARVEVVGTGFTVARDRKGTAVSVQHGLVEVTCGNGVVSLLHVGDQRTCIPATARGLLGRAMALEDEGAPTEEVLESVQLGLTLAEPSPTRDELRIKRIGALVKLGRTDAARQAAHEFLDTTPGSSRAPEVAALLRVLGGQ